MRELVEVLAAFWGVLHLLTWTFNYHRHTESGRARWLRLPSQATWIHFKLSTNALHSPSCVHGLLRKLRGALLAESDEDKLTSCLELLRRHLS